MADPRPPLLILLPFAVDPSRSLFSCKYAHILTKIPKNCIYTSTVPLSFETYTEDIYTILLFCDYHHSYFYYIETTILLLLLLMNLLSLYLSPLLFNLLIPFVKTFTPPKSLFPTLMFLQLFSQTFLRRRISYLSMFSLSLLYKLSSQKKPILNSPILNSFVVLKILLIIGLLQIFFKFTTFKINCFKIALQTPKLNKFEYILCFFDNFLDITTNSF